MELARQSLPSWKVPPTSVQQVCVAAVTSLPEPSLHLQAFIGMENMAATARSMMDLILRDGMSAFRCLRNVGLWVAVDLVIEAVRDLSRI